ncbi:hypothetical protein OG738_11555 [Amycolatopsis sp. NBC_01488]|uniref:hypothetical protein n=1 Tax=Amycolatopsis sp. NBC_01488 TaxID=2903563 RepID=UPI002E29A1CA|nr:hypothetical protein [Amycolatopsis sp. NBC_01488]
MRRRGARRWDAPGGALRLAGWGLVVDGPVVARGHVVADGLAVARGPLVADHPVVADRAAVARGCVDRARWCVVADRAAGWRAVFTSRSPGRDVVASGSPGRRVLAGRSTRPPVFAARALVTDRRVLGRRHLARVTVAGRLAAAALRRRRLGRWWLAADRLRRARGAVSPLRR